jgi:hypothetical protein
MSATKRDFRPVRKYAPDIKSKVILDVADGLSDTDIIVKHGLRGGIIGFWKRSDPVFLEEYGVAKLALKEKYLKVVLFLAEHASSESVRLKAATWYLERKYSEEFAQHQVIHAPKERSPLDLLLTQEEDTEESGEDASEEDTIAGEMAE